VATICPVVATQCPALPTQCPPPTAGIPCVEPPIGTAAASAPAQQFERVCPAVQTKAPLMARAPAFAKAPVMLSAASAGSAQVAVN
jgi:hypothetical protein